jgi:hypothetical protein
MKSTIKYFLCMGYIMIGICYMFVDWFTSYGEDGLFFWIAIRPFISGIKGLFWIIAIW